MEKTLQLIRTMETFRKTYKIENPYIAEIDVLR